MTTTVKTIGPLTVTSTLHGNPDRHTIEQEAVDISTREDGATIERSFPIHNTLSLRIEGEGTLVVTATDYPAEVVAGRSITRVEAGASQEIAASGTMIVRQAEPAPVEA